MVPNMVPNNAPQDVHLRSVHVMSVYSQDPLIDMRAEATQRLGLAQANLMSLCLEIDSLEYQTSMNKVDVAADAKSRLQELETLRSAAALRVTKLKGMCNISSHPLYPVSETAAHKEINSDKCHENKTICSYFSVLQRIQNTQVLLVMVLVTCASVRILSEMPNDGSHIIYLCLSTFYTVIELKLLSFVLRTMEMRSWIIRIACLTMLSAWYLISLAQMEFHGKMKKPLELLDVEFVLDNASASVELGAQYCDKFTLVNATLLALYLAVLKCTWRNSIGLPRAHMIFFQDHKWSCAIMTWSCAIMTWTLPNYIYKFPHSKIKPFHSHLPKTRAFRMFSFSYQRVRAWRCSSPLKNVALRVRIRRVIAIGQDSCVNF